MSKQRSNTPSPGEAGGVRGSSIVYVQPTGRRSHRWRIRREGFRAFFMSKGWDPWGSFARKCVRRGFEVWMFTREEHPDYYLCEFIPQNDVWARITRELRERDAREHRRTFQPATSNSRGDEV